MTGTELRAGTFDVAIVGGGPAGCSAGIFTGRYDLETVVFDRGRSSLRRCAHLENYLGFPGGIDVDTFYELMHEHARAAGCELIADTVTGVSHESPRFRVETEGGHSIQAKRVIAATKCDATYLESLEDDRLFSKEDDERRFRDDLVDRNGRTPVDRLYVAGPLAGVGDQTILAAGHGAAVARHLITDVRREAGYWAEIEEPYDWVRYETELDDEWWNRERWHDWLATHDEPEALTREAVDSIRDAYIDEALGMYIDDDEIDRRTRRGQRRIADHLDDRIQLDAIPDERIRAYVETVSSTSRMGEDDE